MVDKSSASHRQLERIAALLSTQIDQLLGLQFSDYSDKDYLQVLGLVLYNHINKVSVSKGVDESDKCVLYFISLLDLLFSDVLDDVCLKLSTTGGNKESKELFDDIMSDINVENKDVSD